MNTLSVPSHYGAHVSASGGLSNAAKNGGELGVNTIQVHPSPPQRWNTKPFSPEVAEAFLAEKAQSPIERVFFHGIYLINLASPDGSFQHLSRNSLVNYLQLMDLVQGDGVIFHVGSMKDEASEDEGYRRAADNINRILDEAKNGARLILEVAAGGGAIIGDRLEELATIYEKVEQRDRVGFGLDTQHLWASGYDIANNLEPIIEQVETVLGLDKVWAIHLNDSKTELASRRDRHENFGKGLIGREALESFFLHPKFAHIPFILETPALRSLDTAKEEVAVLHELVAARSSGKRRVNELAE